MAEYTPSDFGLRLLQTIVLRDVLFWRVELDHVMVDVVVLADPS